jgi:photosystem II stability/assembly factor-like uncharacterized protein
MKKIQTIFAALLLLFTFYTTSLSAQWAPTNGIQGAVDGKFATIGDTVLYLGGNRPFYSVNDGLSWATFQNFPAISGFLNEIVVCDNNILIPNFKELYLSKDRGATWSTIAYPDTVTNYVGTYIQNDTLIFATYGGRFKSGDNGMTWTPILANYTLRNFQYANGALTAIRYPYLVRTTDICETFDTLLQLTANPVIFKKLGEKLFLLMQYASGGCWYSPDDGQTWQQFIGTGFDQYQSLLALGNDIYALKPDFIQKSSDNGQTWTSLSLPVNDYFTDATGNHDIILTATNYHGIYRSTDFCNSWFPANFGLKNAQINGFSITNNHLYANSTRDIYGLNDDQINWSPLNVPFTPFWYGYQQYIESGNKLIVLSSNNLFVSEDQGATWVESSIPGLANQSFYPDDIFVLSSRIFVTSTGSEILVSENNGLSFLPLDDQYDFVFRSAETVFYEQGKLFAKTPNDKLYVSEDEGNTWTLVSDLPVPTSSAAYFSKKMFLSGNNILYFNNNLIANLPQHYLISNDFGQTWVVKDNKIDYIGFDKIFQLKTIGNYAIAATDRGVFISEDNLLTWTPWNDGLSVYRAELIEFFDEHIWVSTPSGIFKRRLSELGVYSARGRVFYDINNNGVEDTGDLPAENVAVKSLTSGSFTTTGSNGQFALLSNLPSEVLAVQTPTPYFTVSPASISTTVPSAGASFALQSHPDAHDLAVSITNTSVLQPGFETNYVVRWRNKGPNPAQNTSISVNFPEGVVTILETSLLPTVQNGNSLTWTLGDVPIGAAGSIVIRVEVPVTVALGTEICVPVSIQQNNPDIYPINNSDESCTTVVGSYDPNDKQATPSERITPAQIATGMPIDYTVRFQNTGTYFATFVRILDTIQAGFDPGTFRFVASSHPCTWTIRGNNIVEFFFDNILLPDQNTNEPGSHGFVRYTIQALPNLPLGTPLNNTAHIFFDYNTAIVTNTTQTLVQNPAKTTEPELAAALQIWPNPARNTAQITQPNIGGQLEIRDAAGRLLLSKSLAPGNNVTPLDLGNWPAGHYDVHWMGENAVLTRKLVVR